MKRSGILRQQRGGLIDQGSAILDAATQANRALTADEVTRHDALMTQIEALNAEIQRAERQEALDAESRAVPAPVVGRDADPVEHRGGSQDTDAAVRGVAGAGGPGPARQEEKRAAPPEAKAGGSPRPLVRFVGEFNLASQVPLESETDAFTALAESIQRSVQQQPDSGHPSSTEGTPQARPSSPVG